MNMVKKMGLSDDSAMKITKLGIIGEMGLILPKKWTPSLADECLPHRDRVSARS
jgi:hypothetical protein